ncbi:hypothetical protein FGO68_gene7284 [Halteria grandinella]|uniref:Uncharacterized protein n=1 Tax=Halteria grandinella TaxID=5974 RepID=A0A8J8NZE6_HALGN|nr:hypothetical protein FGO68_gene7284 [Halteria grandinella]
MQNLFQSESRTNSYLREPNPYYVSLSVIQQSNKYSNTDDLTETLNSDRIYQTTLQLNSNSQEKDQWIHQATTQALNSYKLPTKRSRP